MEEDHKGVSTEMMKQEKLLAEEWHTRKSREEKDRWATEKWQKVWSKFEAKKKQQEAEEKKRSRKKPQPQSKEEAECAEDDDRDEDKDYHPSEDVGNQSSMDPLYKPT